MTSLAKCFAVPLPVLGRSQRLQVRGFPTRFVLARMVKLITGRDGTDQRLIGSDVGSCRPAQGEIAVSILIERANPKTTFTVNLG